MKPAYIKQSSAEIILKAIDERLEARHGRAIATQDISARTGFLPAAVLSVLKWAVAIRFIHESFVPVHIICGKVLGTPYSGKEFIEDAFDLDKLYCSSCYCHLEDRSELKIRSLYADAEEHRARRRHFLSSLGEAVESVIAEVGISFKCPYCDARNKGDDALKRRWHDGRLCRKDNILCEKCHRDVLVLTYTEDNIYRGE